MRINELCRDLEEHTGVNNERTKEIIASQKRIRKHPYRIMKEEREAFSDKMLKESAFKMQELRDFISNMESNNFTNSPGPASKIVNSSTISSRRASQQLLERSALDDLGFKKVAMSPNEPNTPWVNSKKSENS